MQPALKKFFLILSVALFIFHNQSLSAQDSNPSALTETQRETLIKDLLEKSGNRLRWAHHARLEFAYTAYEYVLAHENPDLKLQAMFNIAELYFQQGNFDEAVNFFDSIIEFEPKINIELVVKAKTYKGSIYRLKVQLYEALDIIHSAHKFAEQDDSQHLLPLTSNNLGLVYRSFGDTSLAEEYFERALESAKHHKDTNQIILSKTFMGNLYHSKNRTSEAYSLYLDAMNLAELCHDRQNIALINNNIGNIYRDNGDFEKALEHYYTVLSKLDEIVMAGLETATLRNAGDAYLRMENKDAALEYFSKSLQIAEETGLRWFMRNNYLRLSEIYSQTLQYDSAYIYLSKFNELNREIFDNHLRNSIEYYTDRISEAQRMEEIYRFRLERNLLLLIIAGLLVLFFVSLSVLIYKRFKEKREHIKRLQNALEQKDFTEKALKQSEENYQMLIKTLNEGLIVLDLKNKIEFVNFKACKVLGVNDKNDLIGRDFKNFLLTPEDEKLFHDKMELQKMGISDHYEVKMKNVTGDILWANLSSAPILDENLKSKGSVTLITDVTERKKYEENYNELTSNLNQKIKQLNCLYDISDISGVPGISFEEIINKSLEIIPVGLKYSYDIGVQIMFDNKVYSSPNYKETPWSYTVPIKVQKKKLGHIKVVYLEQKPNINKDPFHFNEKILLKNISEKFGQILESKNLEKVLLENQERLKEIQKIAKIGHWEKDLVKGNYTFSDNFFDIVELTPERRKFFDYEKFKEFIHSEDRDTFKIIEDIDKDHDKVLSFYYRILTHDGKVKNIFSSRKVLRYEDGTATKLVYTIQDITEQKLNQELQHKAEVALKTSEAKQQVLADMSFEMRTPLNGIMGVVEFLLKSELTPEQTNLAGTIKESSEGLMNIINNIQDLSRIENGNFQIEEHQVNIKELVQRITNLFEVLAKEKGVKLIVEINSSVPQYIKTDENRLFQVLSGLITNVIKETKHDTVYLRISVTDATGKSFNVKVEVSDEIEKTSKKHSAKSDKSLRHLKGSDLYHQDGLSLTISNKLVELLGGNLMIKNSEKSGNSFYFSFNATLPDIESTSMKSSGNGDEAMQAIEGLRVLYAEDKIINQKVISLMLSHANCSITIANNGAEALEKLKEQEFDVILMDMIMPVMDGMEAIKAIREKYPDPPPIIGLTAMSMDKSKKLYMENGLDDLITKPVKAAVLYKKLSSWYTQKKVK